MSDICIITTKLEEEAGSRAKSRPSIVNINLDAYTSASSLISPLHTSLVIYRHPKLPYYVHKRECNLVKSTLDKAYVLAYDSPIMLADETLTTTEARKNLYNVVENVHRHGKKYAFTHQGQTAAYVISPEEMESLLETIAIQSDPVAMRKIREGEEAMKRGEYISWEKLKKELKLDNEV